MMTLSIREPHIGDILAGHKRIENRTWRLRALPARLALHRSRAGNPAGAGMVVATVTVAEILPAAEALARFPDQRPYITGPWCWVLSDLRILPRPVGPVRGLPGIFHVALPE